MNMKEKTGRKKQVIKARSMSVMFSLQEISSTRAKSLNHNNVWVGRGH